jgi:hypothetical protein
MSLQLMPNGHGTTELSVRREKRIGQAGAGEGGGAMLGVRFVKVEPTDFVLQ